MRSVRLVLGLVLAALVFLAGTTFFPWFPRAVDPFVIALVWYCIRSGPAQAPLAGTLVGLVQDAFSGGLFGLFGFANTLVGYLVWVAAQRIVVGQQAVWILLFAAASAVQQGLVLALVFLLTPRPDLPDPRWLPVKIVVSALLGALVLASEQRALAGVRGWRRTRSKRLRFR